MPMDIPRNLISKKIFTLKKYHVALLTCSRISFMDNGYLGVFSQDPKRPYGNSDITGDIKKIIYDLYDGDLTDDICYNIHKELHIALEVILESKSFNVGTYSKNETIESKWVRVI